MKDIFIDNDIAKNFGNPMDPEYKKLVAWLLAFDGDLGSCAWLVVSNKLMAEYGRTSGSGRSPTNIIVIIGQLTKEGRLSKISNRQIKEFRREFFTNHICKNLTCNREDRDHIPVVLLSHRKYALSIDDAFVNDLVSFPGFTVFAAKRPQHLPYDQ